MIRISALSRILFRQQLSNRMLANYPVISHLTLKESIRKYSLDVKKENTRELIAAQDSDSFGTLNVGAHEQPDDEFVDEDDIKEEEYIKHPPRNSQKLSTKQYADMIKEHIKYHRIKEALDVLEVRMKEDRVKPENYIFNLLIDATARVGYSKKAFNLFTKMRQRGLKVTGATYTSLFNSCANSPWPQDGLNKANRLREIMLEKGFEPNASNYNAMIKAFGRCNDLNTAFLLVDEMSDKKILIETETFNFLLQACASDMEFGFRHALLVWHKMYQRKLKPDIYSFNLMLRCCRDTNFGDDQSMEEVLQTILLKGSSDLKENQIKLEGKSDAIVQKEVQQDPTPNLLAPIPHLGTMISIKEVKKPEDKLLLLGGMSGFLDLMKHFDVHPDLKTYTELIEVIPPTIAAEKRLINHLQKHDIKCDVDFFNILMKKRSLRFDYESAKEVIGMIEKVHLRPDIVTYGVLALGCQTFEEARELIGEMNNKGIKMNAQILGAMLKTGCVRKNFDYIIEVLYIIKEFKIKPNERMLDCLTILIKSCNKAKKKDWKIASKEFREEFSQFKMRLEAWKSTMGLQDFEIDDVKKALKEAPWEQFQESQSDGYEDVKAIKQRKRSKLIRYIGKIKEKELVE